MKTIYKITTIIVLGIVFVSTGFGVLYMNPGLHPDPRISTADKLEPKTNPKIISEPEEKFKETVKVEGEMAEKICKIVGTNCPPYYIGNPQPDGSLMIGITISDTVTERQFVFLIKNNTLSYTENED